MPSWRNKFTCGANKRQSTFCFSRRPGPRIWGLLCEQHSLHHTTLEATKATRLRERPASRSGYWKPSALPATFFSLFFFYRGAASSPLSLIAFAAQWVNGRVIAEEFEGLCFRQGGGQGVIKVPSTTEQNTSNRSRFGLLVVAVGNEFVSFVVQLGGKDTHQQVDIDFLVTCGSATFKAL